MSSPALFIIASLIWGSTFWAITLQLGEVAPAISVLYRFGLASAILFALCYLRGGRLRLPWKAQRWVMLQGFASFGLSYMCTYSSEQYLVSALVSVLFALMVFWTPICSRIAFGTRLTWRVWCAAAVAIFGVALLFSQSIAAAWQEIMGGGSGHFLIGFALALAATLASSVGNALVIKVRQQSSNVMLTMAWAMLWGCVLVAVWVLVSGQPWRLPSKPRYWMGLFYLAIFGSVIAFAAYFTLIDRIGAQKAVYIGVVTPVISVLLSIQLEHYHPGLIEWTGMILCLSSVAWALKSPSIDRAAPKPAGAIPFNASREASSISPVSASIE
ncbi:DMT family transporter [Collimonas sp.]|jgi:drug/metabolite transporter (DMT)-like permease|uniref:DMT family transporter n=1 Tax=Collimonas sp. TaxID=1963772 RepID=UPI002B9DD00D|nr:EamA family transporter [Collimonas sp.]HWX04024.1 EamA family transporter [Collimonas sp.]